eukprot:CAMPEP_0119565550 /NCGR_PEP_ID=MMETSP1352-20130426/30424_1 /TAXON_ID=265584 /ORGANISM="Stauroneis constricta, Strain CCMP1120" /LENGTH=252 /DNA_ID=CAMNT_0007614489 /DNA_START=123 /DNA_END=881 /DNA_ORIENTATION=+
MAYEYEWRSFVAATQRMLQCLVRTSCLVLHSEETSIIGIIAKAVVSIATYIIIWTKVAILSLGFLAWLIMAGQYLLALTTSFVLILVAGILLLLYQFMWDWQSIFCHRHRGALFGDSIAGSNDEDNDGQRIQPGRPIQIDDSDEDWDSISWVEWAKYGAKYLLLLCSWTVFCWMNTKFMFWIFDQYIQAHPRHNSELFLVNNLETAPLLLGAAIFLRYMHPKYFSITVTTTANITATTSSGADDHSIAQPLL